MDNQSYSMSSSVGNRFGLSERDVLTLRRILAKHPTVGIVHVFGSRAKGNYKIGSDIDLAIMNEGVSEKTVNRIKSEYEESDLPYRVDIVNLPTLKHQELLEHIKRVGVLFYTRQANG